MLTIKINNRFKSSSDKYIGQDWSAPFIPFKIGRVKRSELSGYDSRDKGFVWAVFYEDGKLHSLGLMASGRDCYRKKDFAVIAQ